MQIIRNLEKIHNIGATSLTVGNFDGLHLGHQKIIDKIKGKAKTRGLKSAILTFYPHPAKYFKPQMTENFLLYSLAQKLKFFKQNSIDYVFILPFNEKIAQLEAEKFIAEILKNTIKASQITIGYDFTFGKNRSGDFDLLQKLSQKYDYEVEKIDAFSEQGITASSSVIRNFLMTGKIREANNLLAKNYKIDGIVKKGKQLGRKIGFNTANLSAKKHLIQPKFGVYKTKTFIHDLNKTFDSITNFGIKPTFKNESEPLFETHIFNYEDQNELYGRKISVELIDFIRNEKKFNDISELKSQIEEDVKLAKSMTI